MKKHLVKTEIGAGLTAFLAIAYLFVLIPQILSEGGLPFGASLTASALVVAAATLLLALYGNYPAAIGPGLSALTYLAFSVVGAGKASWPEAFGIVFYSGLALFLLSAAGLRQTIFHHTPPALKQGAVSGLGLFLIAVGLKQMGIVSWKDGGYHFGIFGTPEQAIALFALLLLLWLRQRFPRLAFPMPILAAWGLSLLFGFSAWKGTFSLPAPPQLLQADFSAILNPKLLAAALSIVVITLLDTGATLSAFSHLLGQPRLNKQVLIPDTIGSMLASFLGTTSCAFYAESSAGIYAGGRTPLVGCTVAFCSLCALFLAPLLSSIPPCATAPILLAIGGLLASHLKTLKGKEPLHWISSLATALGIVLFFSLYWGLAIGFILYCLLSLALGRARKVHASVWILTLLFLLRMVL